MCIRDRSNPAVVSEIDGEVTMGKVKRGNREIVVTSKTGEVKKYPVSYTHLDVYKRQVVLLPLKKKLLLM